MTGKRVYRSLSHYTFLDALLEFREIRSVLPKFVYFCVGPFQIPRQFVIGHDIQRVLPLGLGQGFAESDYLGCFVTPLWIQVVKFAPVEAATLGHAFE